jgi:signal transduction histidine kinase
LERQLLRSERLASLSQFASMFAHDIRNPLAGMKKTLEWMAQKPELQSDSLGRWFNDLQFTTELLLGMINDMLDVYQDSYAGLPLTTSQFSVPSLLEEVTRLFRSEAEARRISFRVEPFDQEQLLTGDRRRLLRVGINLVHNALKYSPAGGIITLSARLREESGPSGILGAQAEPALLLSVEDEGPGIEPDELPHIFDLFFRKKDGRDLRIGRGLGLHFCRLVVEAHHGRMWAANRPSGGAQFCIFLPINAERLCPSGL